MLNLLIPNFMSTLFIRLLFGILIVIISLFFIETIVKLALCSRCLIKEKRNVEIQRHDIVHTEKHPKHPLYYKEDKYGDNCWAFKEKVEEYYYRVDCEFCYYLNCWKDEKAKNAREKNWIKENKENYRVRNYNRIY